VKRENGFLVDTSHVVVKRRAECGPADIMPNLCPSCREGIMEVSIMFENNEPIPILKCPNCGNYKGVN